LSRPSVFCQKESDGKLQKSDGKLQKSDGKLQKLDGKLQKSDGCQKMFLFFCCLCKCGFRKFLKHWRCTNADPIGDYVRRDSQDNESDDANDFSTFVKTIEIYGQDNESDDDATDFSTFVKTIKIYGQDDQHIR
jgi:hypothetical protein